MAEATGDLASEGAVVLADKPSGVTSHDVVDQVRRELGVRRVGHAGTLDPFATGLLIVLVGRPATREQSRFMALPKTYRTVARLGAVSTTGDREGEITVTGRVPERLKLPTGRIRQRPPAYSAVKVDGERAYKRARRGERFELPEREVTVYRFEELRREGDEVELEIECSSGTYVRSLVADLGDAYCLELRRTRIGPFSVEEAGPEPIPLQVALARLPASD
ncbi:MAG TPA: tRNA pseudouridine(55) synthase TruB [Solirubrobacterales bacterium]